MAMNFVIETKYKHYQYKAPHAKAEQEIFPVTMMCP